MSGPFAALSPRAYAALAAALAALVLFGLSGSLPGPILFDYGSFVASGRAAGEGLDPYGIHPLTFRVAMPGFEIANPNLNPPVSIPLFQLFDLVDPHAGFRLWWALSLLGYAAAVALLVRRYCRDAWLLPALWAFALAGFWDTLVLGQIYVPLALAAVGAWLLLERNRAVAAGLLIGFVVAVKPNFLVWPGLLLLAGHRRAALAAFAAAAALSLVPTALYGPSIYGRWIELIASDSGRAVFLTNASLSGLALRAGLDHLGTAASAALLAALALWAWRMRPPPLAASALGLIGAVLASPIAWVHYTLFLLPVFFAHRTSWPLRVAAALLVVPVPLVLQLVDAPAWAQVTLGSIYAWAVILCLGDVATERARRGAVDWMTPAIPLGRARPMRTPM